MNTDGGGLPRDRLRLGIVVALLVVGGVFLWDVQRDRDRLGDALGESTDRTDELASAVASLSGQVQALGGDPVVEVEPGEDGPELVPGPQGERGPRGPAPSDAQVEVAVQRYCGINDCTGPQGPAPSAFQVAAAVASYCDVRGECRGATGAAGESVIGPQGPGPSGEQIAAAVEAFCAARDGCAGPAGADGDDSTVPGPQGEPGPACPEGAAPIVWTVDQARSAVIGLEPGTYLICVAGD